MGTEADANAGTEQSLTEQPGTPDGSQSLNDQEAEARTIEGLSRTVTKQQRLIKELTEKAAVTQATPDEAAKKELDEARAELAKSKLLLKHRDIADKLEPILNKGLNPEFVDDDFVAILRNGADEREEEAPAHNPVRGRGTPEQDATKLLKSLDSLF